MKVLSTFLKDIDKCFIIWCVKEFLSVNESIVNMINTLIYLDSSGFNHDSIYHKTVKLSTWPKIIILDFNLISDIFYIG